MSYLVPVRRPLWPRLLLGAVVIAVLSYLGACAPPLLQAESGSWEGAGVAPLAPLGAPLDAGERAGISGETPAPTPLTATHGESADSDPVLRTVTTAPLRPTLRRGARHDADLPDVSLEPARVRVDDIEGGGGVAAALDVPGVAFATGVRTGSLLIAAEHGTVALRYVAAEPGGFRLMAPEYTAADGRVWRELADGGLVVDHRTARVHGLRLGFPLRTPGGAMRLDAYASASAWLGDALLTRTRAGELGLDGPESILVALDSGQDPGAVAARLEEAGVGRTEVLEQETVHTAGLVGEDESSVTALGEFTYTDDGDGSITISQAWIDEHIVRTSVPILGEVVCHEALIEPLTAVMAELQTWNLDHHVHASDYGGCWNPRHIDSDPGRSLSLHAFGIAVDVNVSTNWLGEEPQLDPAVVAAFERHGFVWGGEWRRPDGMHFELGTLHP